ncbi:MAG TPA: RluA family pseudouridine synthase, partial [Candidatus Dormibacteraeota bacterium]|nr:RluA family pseudouridine synthase [Candidatus Dormibacteraeota bacterium]
EHLLVIDKPAGLVVHPGGGTRSGTLVNALLARHADWPSLGGPTRPGIVHRLDKGTSGLMLVARSELALRRLSADLAARRVSRTYLAVAAGVLADPGRIEAPIGRDPRERKRMAVVENGRPSTTTFTPLRALRDATLLEVTLGSGRTHQIRVHLAAIGHPLLGDDVYGPRAGSTLIGRPALHAHRLRFRHPATEAELEFETPAPADFAALLRALGEPVAEPGGGPAARGSRR